MLQNNHQTPAGSRIKTLKVVNETLETAIMSFIKIKSKSNRFYIFDSLVNHFYEIDEATYSTDISHSDLGYESPYREINLIDFNHAFSNNAKTLMIELTEKCNLRCSYCIYDDNKTYYREHGDKQIDKKFLFKELDSFTDRVSNTGFIVFYGGEPTLSFNLIKEVVEYVKNNKQQTFKFSLTTNAYSLSKSMINYFIENDFLLTISLDGDKLTHDKNRITVNGGGTHERIITTLKKIKETSELFYNNNIHINCVVNGIEDISSINDFFFNFDLSEENLRYSPVIQKSKEINKYILNSIKNKSTKELDSFSIEKLFISSILNNIRHRKVDENIINSRKLCIPFVDRTYVKASGDLTFCERVGSYGDVRNEDGSLKKAASNIYNNFYLEKLQDCKGCFAYNFCELCIASFVIDGDLNLEKGRDKCKEFRDTTKIALEMYINESENSKND